MCKIYSFIACLCIGAFALVGCGGTYGNSLLSQGTKGSNITSGLDASSLLTGLVGTLATNTSESSLVGTWVYKEPSIQFESENFLAKAGGSVASTAIVQKLEPYYKSVGITPGKFQFVFNKDKSCSYTMSGKTFKGTYSFDKSKNMVTITGTLITFPSFYVTVSGNSLAMTFDATKLLSLAQGLASNSQNSTISGLSSLTSSFNGMKAGFLFQKK
jgi:hypothetical protein